MMKTLVLPIRFNKPINRISKNTETFLEKIASLAMSGRELDCRCLNVYPITNPRDFPPGPLATHVLNTAVDNERLDLLVVDVGGPNEREVLQPRFVMALAAMISTVKRDLPELKIFLALPRPLDEDDEFSPMLDIVFSEHNVARFYYQDRSLYSSFVDKKVIESKRPFVKAWLEAAEINPKNMLERKMVCHVGNFEIHSIGKRVLDYYEGDFATSEIYRLSCDLLQELTADGSSIRVLFDDRVSAWFDRPVTNAINRFEELVQPVRYSELTSDEEIENVDLVLLPIVRTGQSAMEILSRIGYGSRPVVPKVVTLIDVGDESANQNGIRMLDLPNSELQARIEVMAWLGDRAERLSNIWGRLEIDPILTNEIDLAGKIPSDSMWAMVFEAGLEHENDVPSYRPSLGTIPDFSRLIELNGPLFAAKINRTLGKFFGPNVGRNFAFIHPDENAANLLAACVWDLADLDSISIRSRLIELAEFSNSSFELLDRAESESSDLGEYAKKLIDRLKFVSRNASIGSANPFRVVVLSEFQASGSRMNGLVNFSRLLGWEVLGSISLARMYAAQEADFGGDYYYYQFGFDAVGDRAALS